MSAWGLAIFAALAAANPDLSEGRRLYDRMQFREAEARLRLARQAPDVTPEQLREILDLLARALLVQGRAREAEDTYAELLASDPHAPEPADVAPKFSEAFRRAKQRLYPRGYVRLLARTPERGATELTVVDPWRRVSRLVVHEARPKGPFVPRELGWSPSEAIRLSAGPGQTLQWWAEARAADGAKLAELGSPEAPQELVGPVPAPEAAVAIERREPEPPRTGWAHWPLFAASAVAGGAGAYLAVSSGQSYRAAEEAYWGSDRLALGNRAHSEAVAANVLIGAAVISGAAGAAAWVFEW